MSLSKAATSFSVKPSDASAVTPQPYVQKIKCAECGAEGAVKRWPSDPAKCPLCLGVARIINTSADEGIRYGVKEASIEVCHAALHRIKDDLGRVTLRSALHRRVRKLVKDGKGVARG